MSHCGYEQVLPVAVFGLGFADDVLREEMKMNFRSTLALLLTLVAFGAACPAVGAGTSTAVLEKATGPEALVRMEQKGEITVRALGAWGRLPARFVSMGRTLRASAGLDLLDATTGTVADWLALAEGGDARLAPVKDGLKDLLKYLQRGEFLDWETVVDEEGVTSGELLRRDGRMWVHGPQGQGQAVSEAADPLTMVAHVPQVLFDGDMSGKWIPYQSGGGKFKDFALIDKGMLIVDVPPGNTWGRTGMYSNGTVIGHPRGAAEGVRLTAWFDPDASTDAIVSLVPGEAKTDDEWSHHHVRLGMHLEAGEDQQSMTLWIDQKTVMSRIITSVPERIDIVIRPDDAVVITDAGGKVLLQGVMPPDAPQDGYRLYALTGSTSKRRGKPVRMALKRIERSPEPFATQPAHDSIPDGAQRLTLFENGVLGRWLTPFAGQGGDFLKHARLEDGEVEVNVPADSRWGKVGVYSPEAVLWLDRFGPGAEAAVTFEFDSSRTTGFVVALSPLYNFKDNDPSRPYVWAQWNAKEDGTAGKAQVLITPDFPKVAWEWETTATAPENVTLRISPDGVLVQGFGAPEERMPWKWLVPNMGFRVYAFSQAVAARQPVRMTLRRITMERTPGAPLPSSDPAPGIEPLEVKTLFPGPDGTAWEPYGKGADFAAHGNLEGGRLVVDVPADKYGWPKVGVVSKEPVIAFNERIQEIPYAVRIHCDPSRTSGVEAVFRSAKSADMEKSAQVLVSFVRHVSGADAGTYVLSLKGDNTTFRNWSRRVDAGWVERNWDGVLEIRLGDGWAEAGLPGGPAVRGTDLRIGKGYTYHMAVTSCPDAKSGASTLVLDKVTGGWVSPPGMTADERWNFVDDESFDTEAFINDLADGLPEQ
jgi:hypothetical protein